jgi:hypothetical protein
MYVFIYIHDIRPKHDQDIYDSHDEVTYLCAYVYIHMLVDICILINTYHPHCEQHVCNNPLNESCTYIYIYIYVCICIQIYICLYIVI